jgi:hypothetical protein
MNLTIPSNPRIFLSSVEFHLRERWSAGHDFTWPIGLFNDSDPLDTFIRAPQNILNSMWSPDTFIPNSRETSEI